MDVVDTFEMEIKKSSVVKIILLEHNLKFFCLFVDFC